MRVLRLHLLTTSSRPVLSRCFQSALNAVTWLVKAGSPDIPARAANLELYDVVYEVTASKFTAEPTIAVRKA